MTTATMPVTKKAPPSPLQEFWQAFSANKGALIALIVFFSIRVPEFRT